MRLKIKLILSATLALLMLGVFSSKETLVQAAGTQDCTPQAIAVARATGLITAQSLGGGSLFQNTTGVCVIGATEARLSSIPDFNDLKRQYYDNAKSVPGKVNKNLPLTKNATQLDMPLSSGTNQLYYIKGGLTISGSTPSGDSAVVFVEHDLEFLTGYFSGSSGTIFVVKGDVYINPTVAQIGAVIIAEGTIYTAAVSGVPCDNAAVDTPSRLLVNGSLISLGANPIKFCRKIADNTNPAELIVAQPKYLAIFRDLFATDYSAREEDKVIGSYQNLFP